MGGGSNNVEHVEEFVIVEADDDVMMDTTTEPKPADVSIKVKAPDKEEAKPLEPTSTKVEREPKEEEEEKKSEREGTKEEETSIQGIIGKLQGSAMLDLVFAMDCTGSMGSYIRSAQDSIRSIVDAISSEEDADVKFGLVAYRDHPPQDRSYVTKVFEFTDDVNEMKTSLNTLTANGGGDGPEAVADAMYEVTKMGFRQQSTKVCILISDAPPHGLQGNGDGFPNGCPSGHDVIQLARAMATMGVTLYTVGCEPSINQYKSFFESLALITGGQYCGLQNASILSNLVVGGAQEEIALERLMNDADELVTNDSEKAEVQAKKLFEEMSKRGRKAKKLQRCAADLPRASATAFGYAKSTTLEECRKMWSPDSAPHSMPLKPTSSLFSRRGSKSKKKSMWGGASYGGAAAAGGAPHAPIPAPMADRESYSTMEDCVSLAQCERMVYKSRARKGWF